jgi:hypothetical protein
MNENEHNMKNIFKPKILGTVPAKFDDFGTQI